MNNLERLADTCMKVKIKENKNVTQYRKWEHLMFNSCCSIDSPMYICADITEVKHGYHMLNGIEQRLSSTRDVRECIAHCTTSDSCYAVDFDVRGSRCFLHTLSTVCGTGRKKIYCTHYKFTRCGQYALLISQVSLGELFFCYLLMLPSLFPKECISRIGSILFDILHNGHINER